MRKLSVLVTLILIAAVVAYIKFELEHNYKKLDLIIEPTIISADGHSTSTVKVILCDETGRKSRFAKTDISLFVGNEECIKIFGSGTTKTQNSEAEFMLCSTIFDGVSEIGVKDKSGKMVIAQIKTTPVYSDFDKDGFPDVAELTSEKDRWNFRNAFVKIAEAQLDTFSPLWNANERDCAGLVRFAYREALKKHDAEWMQQIGLARMDRPEQIEKYNYPKVPILGTKIFRTKGGEFKISDLSDSTFSSFVKGHYLKDFNTIPIGKDKNKIKKGDILFFLHYDDPQMPFHTMIYIGDDNGIPEAGNDDWLVYHTGPVGDTNGKIKKLRLSTLNKHPDERWCAVVTNPYFLGFYRWKILE